MRRRIKKMADYILPAETQRRRLAGKLARRLKLLEKAHPDIHYGEWVERTEPFTWTPVEELAYQPMISIVVPVFNPPAKYLLPMVYSVVNQRGYQNWELILVSASTEPAARRLTESCAEIDNRIRTIEINGNKGIAANTNAGIKAAKGDYVGLLDHDDLLAPRALYEITRCLQQVPRPQLVYSDEDKLSENGEYRFDPFFKPDWSPHLLRQVNYLNHFSVIDIKMIDICGGYRQGFEGAQDYDLFLRIVDRQPIIAHASGILYHWRAAHGSTAQNFSTKKHIVDAASKALEEHLERNNLKGRVQPMPKQPGFYQTSYSLKDGASIAVLVLPSPITEQYIKLADQLLSNLKHTAVPVELYLSAADKRLVQHRHPMLKLKLVPAKNIASFVKKALDQTSAEVIAVINSGVVPQQADWLQQLAGLVLQDKTVGAAAPLLTDFTGRFIEDAGYVKQSSNYIPLFENLTTKVNTYFGNSVWGRDVDALSGRLMVIRRKIFEEYFTGFYSQTKPTGYAAFDKIRRDGLWLVTCANVPMIYCGELYPSTADGAYFNPALMSRRRGISVAKTINMPGIKHYE